MSLMEILSFCRQRGSTRLCCALLLFVTSLAPVHAASSNEVVVLLHGLARSKTSMEEMSEKLSAKGFSVCNVGYPSREFTVETLTAEHVLPAIEQCLAGKAQPRVNFVTHSMGGILVRQLRASKARLNFGRVVMLGPPNAGSEVVDKLGDWSLFQWLNGPAAQELGTGAPLLQKLGATDLEVGIIAGSSTINPILSSMIPGDDDGKVSIEHAKLPGMKDFLVLPVSHPFLMTDDVVIEQTLNFLSEGRFRHDSAKR